MKYQAFLAMTLLVLFTPAAFAAISIPFTVTMSEAVNVTGCPANCPRIAVTVDGQTRYAQYSAGTGSSSLTFIYAPTIGDLDLDGVTLTSPIDLNGGTITDLNGNAITPLTYTVPDTSGIKIDYPSLSMDFVADADGRYTLNGTAYNDLSSFLGAAGGSFTRASVGTYYDASGVLQTAASGTPRFDHDPVTHAAKGILIEESRTNYFKNSAALPSNTNLSPTLTSNIATDPMGGMNADQVAASTTGSGVYGNSTNAALTAGTQYTISAYIKKISGVDTITFGVPNSFTNNTGDWTTRFDFSTNNFSSTNSNLSNPVVTNIGNNWVRLSVTATLATGGTGGGPLIYSYGGAVTFLLWGSQIEAGAFPTSYIPTTNAVVTREADILTIPTGTWYNQTAGTLFGFANSVVMNVDHRIATIRESASDYFGLRITSSNLAQMVAYDSGGIKSITAAGALSAGNTKMVVTQQMNDVALLYNGGTLVTGSAWSPVTASYLAIGYDGVAPTLGFAFMNGYIKGIKYYPTRVSNTQLQLMTQ
ncbi:MAG: hypothetical protein PHX61_03555 [Alphaproteobacteria bacterium]|nr:hypothetical protein [Alphaproteobacteria bacterium]